MPDVAPRPLMRPSDLQAGDEPGTHRFEVVERLTRLDGRLFGGTAIAVSLATAEAVTQRPTLRVSRQVRIWRCAAGGSSTRCALVSARRSRRRKLTSRWPCPTGSMRAIRCRRSQVPGGR